MPLSIRSTMLAAAAMATLVSGCVSGPAPANHVDAVYGPGQVTWAGSDQPQGEWVSQRPPSAPEAPCLAPIPAEIAGLTEVAREALPRSAHLLSPGDRIQLAVLGDEDELTGEYVVASDGTILLRGLGAVTVRGRSLDAVEGELHSALVSRRIVRPLRNAVSLALIQAAGVRVAVHGAVFNEGVVRAGDRSAEDRQAAASGQLSGDDNSVRTLSTAIRAAGGVRPDADLRVIYLLRGDGYARLDMGHYIRGTSDDDVAVASGDRIIVPSNGCFDPELARPTPLTLPGIRVYMSNLTSSANNNAGAAIGVETTSLPYGTRLLQALVQANCVGGSYMQADRRAVLISRNPITGDSIVIERDIERLVRDANRDALDPYLMPGDAIACYDSRWTNLREAVGMVSEGLSTATPALLIDRAL